MATTKLAYWKKPKMALVSNEAVTMTIAYWPRVEVVLIVATVIIWGPILLAWVIATEL